MELRNEHVTTTRLTSIGAAVVVIGSLVGLAGCGSAAPGTGHTTAARTSPPTPVTAPAAPLTLVSVSPAPGTTLASASTPVVLTFSAPVAAGATDPEVSPATPGGWSTVGATMTFTPSLDYAPFVPLTLTVPAGLRGSDRSVLSSAVTLRYTTAAPSTLRVQQLLAELEYLPLAWAPAGATAPTVAAPPAPGATATVAAADIPVGDQPGSFAWRWASIPPGLGSQWAQGATNQITSGAVMAFEADHSLAIDGIAGPSVWAALTGAVAAGQTDPRPYDYISVKMALPQTLDVWQAGAVVYSTPVNTGVAGAPTEPGTYPVYERFVSTTMSGHNPDGSVYHDPGIPWVAYFHGGDAIHGFVRAAYGFPQSVGCVELPPSHAQAVYPMDYYGTLVTVS